MTKKQSSARIILGRDFEMLIERQSVMAAPFALESGLA